MTNKISPKTDMRSVIVVFSIVAMLVGSFGFKSADAAASYAGARPWKDGASKYGQRIYSEVEYREHQTGANAGSAKSRNAKTPRAGVSILKMR